ncbi:hypothetical protein C8R46DRAFT_1238664 [Mycena filopes]|nr:hypothetical protein C8R46DRAFT_1238664 [Mycena filopes]
MPTTTRRHGARRQSRPLQSCARGIPVVDGTKVRFFKLYADKFRLSYSHKYLRAFRAFIVHEYLNRFGYAVLHTRFNGFRKIAPGDARERLALRQILYRKIALWYSHQDPVWFACFWVKNPRGARNANSISNPSDVSPVDSPFQLQRLVAKHSISLHSYYPFDSSTISGRRTSARFDVAPIVLSPIPERGAESESLQRMIDENTESPDDSMVAETSHLDLRNWTRGEVLWDGFYKDDEDSLEDEEEPLGQTLALIIGKKTLDEQEILDAGESREANTFRYSILRELSDSRENAIHNLQWYLSEASKLVPGRTRYFRVDPKDTLLPVLQGASDPQQIRVAWDLLRLRLETGERFFKKYIEEAAAGKMITASPVSTTTSLLEGFDSLTSTEQKMKHFVTYYPRHKEDLTTARERLTLVSSNWDTVYHQRAASVSPDREPATAQTDEPSWHRREQSDASNSEAEKLVAG